MMNNLQVMNVLAKIENKENEMFERQRAGKWEQQNARWNKIIEKLEERRERQTDVIMPATEVVDRLIGKERTIFSPAALNQFLVRLGIPTKPNSFFTDLPDDLQERLLKHFAAQCEDNLMIRKERRTIEGIEFDVMRGVLSDKYSIIDTVDAMKALDGKFGDELRLKTFVDTDSRFALEIIIGSSPLSLGLKTKDRDAYYPVIGISNSEIGKGSFRFSAGLFNEWCANGALKQFEDWGNETIRHIFTNIKDVTGAISKIEQKALVDASNEILMTYDKARGIFIPNSVAYTEATAEKLKFGKKMTERAVANKEHKYAGDNLFEVVSALTNAVHEATGSHDVREDVELRVQEWLEETIAAKTAVAIK